MDENINVEVIEIKEIPDAPKNADRRPVISLAQAVLLNAFIIGIAIVAAALIMVHGPFAGGDKDGSAQKAETGPMMPDIAKIKTAGEPYIGYANAPVTLAYWSDYQCPFCKQFETGAFQTVLQKYVSTGKVKVVFKDFAFLGPDSTTAALYDRAIWDLYPQQYFTWREAMYNAQDKENDGFGDDASIAKLSATIAGVDVQKVSRRIVSRKDAYQKLIDADRAEGVSFGVQGTPSLITGTKLIPGLVSYETIAAAIDLQLK